MREKTSNVGTNKIPWPKTGNGSLFLDKQKVESHPIVQPLLDPNCEFRQYTSTEHAQIRPLENIRKSFHGSKVCNDDELVRHMSNLPGFLQKVEKESVQGKALNFGVLDWKQLEKWKYKEHVPAKSHHKVSSSSSGYVCMATGPPKMGPYLKKQYSSNGLNPSVASMGKHPISNSCLSSPHKKPPTADVSYSSSTKKVRNETHWRKESFCEGRKTEMCDQEYQAVQSGSIDRHQNCHQRVENNYRSCSETTVNNCQRKDTQKKIAPEKKALSVDLEHKLSLPKNDVVNDGVKKNEMSLTGVDFNPQCAHVGPLPHNVLLMPKHLQMKSCSMSFQFTESGAKEKRISNLSAPQGFGGFSVEFRSSCLLPVNEDVHAQSLIETRNLVTSPANEVGIHKVACPELNPVASVSSESRYKITHEKYTRSTFSGKAPKRSEADIAELPTMKRRHPSATWFSFGFGKMNSSHRFEEMSTAPQLSSTYTATKSGPVTKSSSGMNKFNQEKVTASNKGRSSPLRRLLDPLIKYKGSQSPKIVQPPNEPLYSMASGTLERSQGRESEGVTGLGLLQLTLKNGLPFFKLVVENSSSHMLVAVVKQLPSNDKNNGCMIYAFYSVHEMRKKSMTWPQGSKNKSCGHDFKIVGQMKISSFYVPKLHAKDSSHWAIRECVLYDVDGGQEDKQAFGLLSDMEIAAVVLKSSCQKLNDGHSNYDQKPYQEMEFPQCLLGATDVGEDENSISTAVILPGGAHGNPSKGAPSSLISRWRHGGSCDCGGWDVGCKIRVLTNKDKNGMISKESMSSCAIGRVNLFVQGSERKSKPVLNLESFDNGFYSLGLDPSIPFLEAFATCVAFITSQKFSEILDNSSQEKVLEAITGKSKLKTANTFQGQIPAKYVSCPPSSPVGRI